MQMLTKLWIILETYFLSESDIKPNHLNFKMKY